MVCICTRYCWLNIYTYVFFYAILTTSPFSYLCTLSKQFLCDYESTNPPFCCQGLQRDIESHSKIVNAVLKLCERLRQDEGACSDSSDSDALRLLAVNLESRWHAIWLQSLEWRCRLEEAIAGGQVGDASLAEFCVVIILYYIRAATVHSVMI